MPNEKEKRIAEILGFFSEMHNKALSETTVGVYIGILEKYDLVKIERAFQSLIRQHALNRFPLPADFIQYLEPPAELDDRTTQAWLMATRKMELEGRWNTVKFPDPYIHHTIARFGGWIEWGDRLANASPNDLVWIQKDFERVYKNCLAFIEQSEPIPQLTGICEKENIAKGYVQIDGKPIKQISSGEAPTKENK